jgi:hypothetical protein
LTSWKTYLDGVDDVDTTIKGFMSAGGTLTTGAGATEATSRQHGIHVSSRDVANLKLCVYYLKHMERVQRKPVLNTINLMLVRICRHQQRYEASFKKTEEEMVINDKDWPSTLENILINYSHSRNPPCAPARTHGQIQAPREPPN